MLRVVEIHLHVLMLSNILIVLIDGSFSLHAGKHHGTSSIPCSMLRILLILTEAVSRNGDFYLLTTSFFYFSGIIVSVLFVWLKEPSFGVLILSQCRDLRCLQMSLINYLLITTIGLLYSSLNQFWKIIYFRCFNGWHSSPSVLSWN